jgi:large subunit ribosomal protein L53
MEFLAQCNSRKAKESNPGCELEVKRGNVELPPQITVTFVNGVEEVFDATSTPVHRITKMILEKGQFLETEQMFREAGEQWPVIIPDEELSQHAPGTKVRFLDFKLLYSCVLEIRFFDQVQPENELAVELQLTMFTVIIL